MIEDVHSIDIGEGVPLVFQHGLTANANQITKLLSPVRGMKLLTIDCPGHGFSILPEAYQPSFDRYADDVLRNLDRHNIDKAVFGGLSMGSGIAMNIALRYPERVMGLVLLRPAWLDKSKPENLNILIEALPYMSRPDGQVDFEELSSFKDLCIDLPDVGKSILGIFGSHQQEGLPTVIDSMVLDRPFLSLEDLVKIDVPTLILANDDDPLHPFYMGADIQKSIKGSQLEKITSRYIDGEKYASDVRSSVSEFISQFKK